MDGWGGLCELDRKQWARWKDVEYACKQPVCCHFVVVVADLHKLIKIIGTHSVSEGGRENEWGWAWVKSFVGCFGYWKWVMMIVDDCWGGVATSSPAVRMWGEFINGWLLSSSWSSWSSSCGHREILFWSSLVDCVLQGDDGLRCDGKKESKSKQHDQ